MTNPDKDFPFKDAPNTAAIVCRHIPEQDAPILYACHDEDDGMWQFLCGKGHKADDAKIVSLKWVYEHDPSVALLKDMPVGYYAERPSVNAQWIVCKELE